MCFFYAAGTNSAMNITIVIGLSAVLFFHLPISSAWMPDVHPDFQPKNEVIISKFIGSASDYFKILAYDEATLLVGARGVIYNISLDGLHEISRIEWHSSDADRQICTLKGKRESDCHNYLRVFVRTDANKIMICGTNSYKPRCRHYTESSQRTAENVHHYELLSDVEAQGICPYSPSHNSTYIYTGGQLYTAGLADFSGSDPLIYREPLRTEQYDLKQLNQPDFVGAVEINEYVMFFFREISMEYMNCGKAIYSRVGRVCKNDRGGPYTLSKSWTSFLKTRLNCSVPGEYPFYFDEIQAISGIVESNSNSSALIYSVFTTSTNAIPGSAVCAFKVEDILAPFEGRFKSQKDSQSNWLPIQNEQVPKPRPGQCVDDSRMLSSTAVNFVKNHPLMETAVPAAYDQPLLTKVNLHHRLTSIAVDRQVIALNGESYDVIYTGTDDGKITKFIYIRPQKKDNETEQPLKPVVISERQVLPLGVAVRELFVASNNLVVVSDGSLVTVPLYHCASIYDCQTCLSLQDPNCAWDLQNYECKKLGGNKFGTKSYLQSLNTTKKVASALCPKTVARGSQGVGIMTAGSTASVAVDGDISNDVSTDLNGQMPGIIGVDQLLTNVDNSEANLFSKKGRNSIAGKNEGKFSMNGGGNSAAENTYGGGEYFVNGLSNNNQITLTSAPDDFIRSLNDPLQASDMVNDRRMQLAGKSFYWGFAIVVLALVFIIGLFFGLYTSRRMCKATAFHANHRNQLSTPRPFGTNHHRNSGKDVNLLVNTHPFVSCNQKKANVDIVGEKDRSHESKNSTENLEKEIPCKTSTLTKVKRTYI